MPVIKTADAENLPRASKAPPHPQRAALDLRNQQDGAGYEALTPWEFRKGYRRPRWHSFFHERCGTVSDFQYDGIADTLARDPTRAAWTWKGIICLHCGGHFPIEGDDQGRPGEFWWVDTAGNRVPIKVGTIPPDGPALVVHASVNVNATEGS